MTLVALPLIPASDDEDADERDQGEVSIEVWKRHLGVLDTDVPWWAVALVESEFALDSRERRICRRMLVGREPRAWAPNTLRRAAAEANMDAWARVVERARQVAPQDPAQWCSLAYDRTDKVSGKAGHWALRVRRAALSSPRAFADFVDFRDPAGDRVVLKGFQVFSVCAMRHDDPIEILMAYGHGKTYLSNIVVPLMDWAEWRDATQGRIYLGDSNQAKWVRLLRQEVEGNQRLQQLFPWIRKPRSGDPAVGVWSTERFAIGGRTRSDHSFEALSIQTYRIGTRYHRVGVDDVVTSRYARSIAVMDSYWDYLNQAAMTMREAGGPASAFGTRWGTLYLVGTPFEVNDVNWRAWTEWGKHGWRRLKFDIYPLRGSRDRGETLWPEKRPMAWALEQEKKLGPRAFRMRCRMQVSSSRNAVFPTHLVQRAMRADLEFGAPPPNSRLLLALDPAKGAKSRGRGTKQAAHPAWSLWATTQHVTTTFHHWVAWARLEGMPFTQQCDTAIELARRYLCPLAIETNNTQQSYLDYIGDVAPDVQLVDHRTTANIRDPDDGIEQFLPLLHAGTLLIHTGNCPEHLREMLWREITLYPNHTFKDVLVSGWIARYQMAMRQPYENPVDIRYPVPAYVRAFGGPRIYTAGEPWAMGMPR